MAKKKKTIISIIASAIGGISVGIPIFQFATGVNSLPEAMNKADNQQRVVSNNENQNNQIDVDKKNTGQSNYDSENNINDNTKNSNSIKKTTDDRIESENNASGIIKDMMGNEITWNISDSTLIFQGNGEIPNRGASCEYYELSDKVKTVVVEEGITAIGDSAFYDMQIEDVVLPQSLRNIGHHAFSSTTVTSIVLSDNVSSVDYGAFVDCQYLTDVYVYGLHTYFYPDIFYDSPNVQIYGYDGSIIQEYALENDLPFKLLS